MVIGLTGGIASGKSTVAAMLAEMGAYVIDADQVARDVVEPGQPAWQEIKDYFGDQILESDGRLNRPLLAKMIFKDDEKRKALNKIIHPHIRFEMRRRQAEAVQTGEEVIVLDIPLLFESGLEHTVDKILVVYVPEAVQLKRLMARDQIDATYAKQKIDSQMPLEEKKRRASAFLDNSGSIEETRAQLLNVLKEWGVELPQSNETH